MTDSIKGYTMRNSKLRIMPTKLSKIDKIALKTNNWMDKQFTSYWIEDPAKYDPIWNKKFAELIVRECAKEAFEFWCNQVDPNEESAQSHILKHFGVGVK
jgi:hypothetical protein